MYVVEQALAAAAQFDLTVTFLPLPASEHAELAPVIFTIGYTTDGATMHTITMVLRRTGGVAAEEVPITNIVDTSFSRFGSAEGNIIVPRRSTAATPPSQPAVAASYEFNFTTVGKAEDASFIMIWGWRAVA